MRAAIIPPNVVDAISFSPIEFGLWLAAAFFAGGFVALVFHYGWRA